MTGSELMQSRLEANLDNKNTYIKFTLLKSLISNDHHISCKVMKSYDYKIFTIAGRTSEWAKFGKPAPLVLKNIFLLR